MARIEVKIMLIHILKSFKLTLNEDIGLQWNFTESMYHIEPTNFVILEKI
jgi:hypothetical protein